MRLFVLIFAFGLFAAPESYASQPGVELLNSTLIAKLHMDETARKGQMVGAYQIRFRNPGNKPISQVPILLNPGLSITKIVGAGNILLRTTSTIEPVEGMEVLELTTALVPLIKPLNKNDHAEIIIHFRGYLEDLSWTGLDGVKDTLNPDFTMIRAEAFAYPVFASPKITAIKTAMAHKPFFQVAEIELPGANTIAGSHQIANKTITGERTNFTLKNPRPTKLMTLAIAPYQHINEGPVLVSYFAEDKAGARQILDAATAETTRLTRLLGDANKGALLQIVALAEGYSSQSETAIFRDRTFFANPVLNDKMPVLNDKMKAMILRMWQTSKDAKAGHWAKGLDAVTSNLFGTQEEMEAFETTAFAASKALFSADAALRKTALSDYVLDGFAAESDTVSTLGFAVLYKIMGEDDYFSFVRSLRGALNGGYADMESVAEFMGKNLKHKKARKFAKNWFINSKAGKDMNKAKSFADLVSRYK